MTDDERWRMPPVELSMRRHSVSVELRLSGELDTVTAPLLLCEVDRLLEEGCRCLTLNLDAITFMDAAAIGALVQIRARLAEHQGVLEVSCSSPQPRRILRLTGMDETFLAPTAEARPPSIKAIADPGRGSAA